MDTPTPVGFRRRGLAFFIDMIVGIQFGLVVSGLIGISLPLDGPSGMLVMATAGLTGIAYIVFAPFVLPNSVGKFAIASKIIDAETGAKPGALKFFLRGLTVGLWPIEALILMFSSGKRRLGDRLAGTLVVPDPDNTRPWIQRAALPVGAMVVFYFLSIGALGMAASRTAIFAAARNQLAAELGKGAGEAEFGAPVEIDSMPRRVQVINDNGFIVVGVSGPKKSAYVNLLMSRRGDEWSYQYVEVAKEPGSRGYSFVTTGGSGIKR